MKIFSFAEMNPAHVIFLKDPPRPLLIDELVQYPTYRQLVVGVPEDALNETLPAKAIEDAKSRFGPKPNPVLIAPVSQSYSMELQQHVRKPFGQFEPAGETFTRIGRRLPKVTCIASLRCPLPISRSDEGSEFGYSNATLVWFQENFALPIDAAVMTQIQALDWSTIAVDAAD